jgi:hypothetical protein
LGCWSHRICSDGREIQYDHQIWRRYRRVILEALQSSTIGRSGVRGGINVETRNPEVPREIYTIDLEKRA